MAPQATGTPLRIGVLGCGDIAWRHTLPAMVRVPDVEPAAVASRDLAKAERFAAEYGGAPVQGYENLLARADVDAVYIALPAGLHHEWALRALEAGKHVLVEKPVTTTLAEADELATCAEKHGRWLMDGFMFLHHSQHAAVRDLLDDGAIGEPRMFSCAFGIPPRPADDVRYQADLGGGALLDVGVYTVRAAQLFLGDDLTVVGSLLQRDAERGIDLGGNALLCSGDGVPAELSFSFRSGYRSMYAIWGSKGRISLHRAFTPPATLRPVVRVTRQSGTEEISLEADDQFGNMLRAFARAARGESEFGPYRATLLRHMGLIDEIRNRARWV
jgi:NDP-hexose-3-ketoreductase